MVCIDEEEDGGEEEEGDGFENRRRPLLLLWAFILSIRSRLSCKTRVGRRYRQCLPWVNSRGRRKKGSPAMLVAPCLGRQLLRFRREMAGVCRRSECASNVSGRGEIKCLQSDLLL